METHPHHPDGDGFIAREVKAARNRVGRRGHEGGKNTPRGDDKSNVSTYPSGIDKGNHRKGPSWEKKNNQRGEFKVLQRGDDKLSRKTKDSSNGYISFNRFRLGFEEKREKK